MSPTFEKIARERSEATRQPYMAWLDALSEGQSLMSQAHLDERSLGILANHCQSPRQLSLIVEAIDAHAKEHPDEHSGFVELAQHADDSPYAMAEWIEAIEYFYDWLAQNNRSSPGIRNLLQYLDCCKQAGSSAPPGYPLVALLEEMLDRYGLE